MQLQWHVPRLCERGAFGGCSAHCRRPWRRGLLVAGPAQAFCPSRSPCVLDPRRWRAGVLPWEGPQPPPAALAAQVRCLAHPALLAPLVALVLPAASAVEAAHLGGRSSSPEAAGSGRAFAGGHGAADMMEMEGPASSSAVGTPGGFVDMQDRGSTRAGGASAAGAPAGGDDDARMRGPSGAAGSAGRPEQAAPVGLGVGQGARALCALLAAVLEAEALQSDALHTLGPQLVGRLWFSYLRVRQSNTSRHTIKKVLLRFRVSYCESLRRQASFAEPAAYVP